MEYFLSEVAILFLILFLGYTIGKISYKGFSLGGAGILILALLFGHAGFIVPKEIMDLGIILYVYSVGLSIGPRLFRTFKFKGWKYILIGIIGPIIGALVVLLFVYFAKIPPILSVGLFSGALTNTPALAKALDIVARSAPENLAKISSSYSIVYPFSMLLLMFTNQLLPKIFHANLKKEAKEYKALEESDHHPLEIKHFRICNPGCIGKSVAEINPKRMINANISRIFRKDRLHPVHSEFILQEGDILRAVGTKEELEKMTLLLGKEIEDFNPPENDFEVLDIKILNQHYIGKKISIISLWSEHEVVVTRVRRGDIEIPPKGSLAVEFGDVFRLVGSKDQIHRVAKELQGDVRQLEQTNLLPFFGGLLMGILIGSITFHISETITLTLGTAGGTFLVSLFLGHYGRIRSTPFYVPQAVKYFSKEFGLLLFMAGAGTMAGSKIIPIMQSYGIQLLLLGIGITLLTFLIMIILVIYIFKLNLSASMGALSGIMTNSPSLASAQINTESVEPTVSYASIYPVALITKIIIAQLLVLFFA